MLDDPAKSYDADLWQAVAEQGWLGAAIPEEYGGLGLGRIELCAIAEELGRVRRADPLRLHRLFPRRGADAGRLARRRRQSGCRRSPPARLIGCFATAEGPGALTEAHGPGQGRGRQADRGEDPGHRRRRRRPGRGAGQGRRPGRASILVDLDGRGRRPRDPEDAGSHPRRRQAHLRRRAGRAAGRAGRGPGPGRGGAATAPPCCWPSSRWAAPTAAWRWPRPTPWSATPSAGRSAATRRSSTSWPTSTSRTSWPAPTPTTAPGR